MSNSTKYTVLIVDDVPQNIFVVENILRDKGIDSIAALNGKTALKILENKLVDLILLDISMPEMDGFELCTLIKQDKRTASIPIIFLTAFNNSNDIVKGFEMGAVDYIVKPFNNLELQHRVMLHLELKNSQNTVIQQNNELMQRNNEISALLQGTKTILGTGNFKDKAQRIYLSCKELIGAKNGFIIVSDIVDNQNYLLLFDTDNTSEIIGEYVPVEISGLCKEVYNTGETFFRNSIEREKCETMMKQFGLFVENILLTPLIIDEKPFGIVGLANKHGGFTANDAYMATAFAEYASIAMLNNKIFEEEKKAKEHFQSIFEHSNVGMCVIDEQGFVQKANLQLSKIVGYSREELENNNIDNITVEEDRHIFTQLIRETKGESIKKAKFEKKFYHKNGGIIYCKVTSTIINDGKRNYFIAHIKDITEQKQVEKENRILREAIIQNPANIVITDVAGNIQFANPVFARTTGYDIDEVVGKNPRVLKSGYTSREEYKELWKTIRSGNVWKGVFLNKRKDGSTYWEHATIAPILNEEGVITNYVAIKEDITERKLFEQERQNYEKKLEELNATKDKFFSIIAHDLKNPFNSIIGFSELLKIKRKDLSEQKLEQYTSIIHSSSTKAYKLLENLLAWARSQMGAMSFTPEMLSFEGVVNDCINIVASQAKSKNIEISSKVDSNLQIFADRNMMNTILRNLLSNAIKFTSRNGNVWLSATLKDEYFEFSIKDSGVGICKETVEKLFNISEKVTREGTENESGTGLGLLLCKEFIEKHKGKIWVESTEGVGTTFFFTISISE